MTNSMTCQFEARNYKTRPKASFFARIQKLESWASKQPIMVRIGKVI